MRRRMTQQGPMEQAPNPGQGEGQSAKQSHFRHSGQRGGQSGMGAERGGSLRQMGGVGFLLRNAEEYNLTELQQENLSQLQTQFELEKVDKEAALRKAKISFRALVRDHNAAERDVLDAIDKVAACEADMRKMRYYHLKAGHAQLDADQLSGLKTQYRQRLRNKVKAFRLLSSGAGGDNS